MLAIRKAYPQDAALISEMGYASYHFHFAHLWHDPVELGDFLRQEYALQTLQQSLHSNTSSWFIAGHSAPVGFAKISWHCAVEDGGPVGTLLHKLYFLPNETGKGYGERFMTELIHLAQRRAETFFWLEVLDANPQAYRFYRRQGFSPIKKTFFATPSQQSTLHIMGKNI